MCSDEAGTTPDEYKTQPCPCLLWDVVRQQRKQRHRQITEYVVAHTSNVSLARIPAVMSASSTPNRATPGKLATNAMGM